MHRLAAGILGAASIALFGGAALWFAEFLAAGDDPWTKLAIAPAVVASMCAVVIGLAAILVWRDRAWGWVGATVLTVAIGVVWIDFGTDSPGGKLAFVLLPSLVVVAMVALSVARLMPPPPDRS